MEVVNLTMKYKLGTSVEVGDMILTTEGWEEVSTKFDDMVVTSEGTEIKYGDIIFGWIKQ